MQRTYLFILIISVVIFSTCRPTPEAPPPNIILIMADDLGYGDLSCYGNTFIQTPHLDKMAAGGLKFLDYHSNGAVCSPTRAALLTGQYQQRAGMEGVIYVRGATRQTGMDTTATTIAEVLRSRGYETAVYGKWHLGYQKKYNPVFHGFDEFRGYVSGNIDYISHYDNAGIADWWHDTVKVEEKGYVTDLITEYTLAFMERNRNGPFFIYVAHEAPHWPYQGRNDKPDRFAGVDFPSQGSREDKSNAYKEMVEIMDEGIGMIIRKTKDLNIADNTLIFFCSDNGGVPQLGNNGDLRGHKTQLWEGGHRVPAIAFWDGKIEPGTTEELVLSMDIFPTLVELAAGGLAYDGDVDGMSISGLLLKRKPLPARTCYWKYRSQSSIRKGKWKFLRDGDHRYLFNIKQDVNEESNLVLDKTGIARKLEEDLDTWYLEVTTGVVQKTR